MGGKKPHKKYDRKKWRQHHRWRVSVCLVRLEHDTSRAVRGWVG